MGMLDLCEAYHFEVMLSQPGVEAISSQNKTPSWHPMQPGVRIRRRDSLLYDCRLLDAVEFWEVLL